MNNENLIEKINNCINDIQLYEKQNIKLQEQIIELQNKIKDNKIERKKKIEHLGQYIHYRKLNLQKKSDNISSKKNNKNLINLQKTNISKSKISKQATLNNFFEDNTQLREHINNMREKYYKNITQ